MSSADPRLRLGEAVALGALHGPAELLPVSSSGHATLVPWLLGWEYARVDGERRKAFEVALHAGTAVALAVVLRGQLARADPAVVALSLLPPAIAGLALERPIERRLGTPATIAAGLLAGAVAMAAADRCTPAARTRADARASDGLVLGLAQACALVPGVSRNGATLAAARARGFAPADASALSWDAALPVLAGAAALKGVRLASCALRPRGGPKAQLDGRALAAGAAAAFVSTLGAARMVPRDRPLAPYAAYRVALAGLVIRRLWKDRRRGIQP
ncbi:MAG: undecaprenyl-diphosphate phosphatase [Solirubrobacteraceae bacterium]